MGNLLSCLKELSFKEKSLSLRLAALEIYTKLDRSYHATQRLIESLHDKDERIVANAVELIGNLNYKRSNEIIYPYLSSQNPRQRANAVIALSKNTKTNRSYNKTNNRSNNKSSNKKRP